MNKGTLTALGAYLLWGFLPIYWKALHSVPAVQIIAHRVIWSFLFVVVLLALQKEWGSFWKAISNRKTILIYLAAAVLLTLNWLVYVWGVNSEHVVETSLGYFINPLVSVLLGVIFLREKLRPLQWVPVGLAAAGVTYLTLSYGSLPWIALALALTWGFYGLVKKTAPLGSLHGLTLETGLAFLPSLAFLLVMDVTGKGAFGHSTTLLNLLMAGAGVITAVPLLLFASAAKDVNLSILGLLFYVSPTCQFLIGVLLYKEPFSHHQLIGFSIVWIALILFWSESLFGFFRAGRQFLTPSK